MRLLTLSRDEIKEITRRHHRGTQCRALKALGIPYRVNDDGWPEVSRQAALQALGGSAPDTDEATVNTEFLNG